MRFRTDPAGRVITGSLVALDDAGLSVRVDPLVFDGPSAARSRIERLWRLSAAERSLPPRQVGETLELAEADRDIEVCFLRANEGGYRFASRVLSIHAEDPGGDEAVAQIAHPRSLAREQRRDYLRVPVYEAVSFACLPSEWQDGEDKGVEVFPPLDQAGFILDLSGGGIRLRSEGPPLRRDERILVQSSFLPPPLDGEILHARAVHVYTEGVEYGLAFEGLPQHLVAAIIRKIEEVVRQARFGVELQVAESAR
jgi:c-di-GMP-binding flagellar brake protein YcgR